MSDGWLLVLAGLALAAGCAIVVVAVLTAGGTL